MSWQQVTALIADPALIRAELDRRIRELQAAPPVVARQTQLEREHARVQRALRRLVDAYQNELLSLDELRTRSAALRTEDRELGRQLEALAAEALDQQGHLQLAETLQSFLTKFGDSVRAAPLADRQRIVRLLVKEVVVGPDSILIRHSIPTPKREGDPEYRLRVGTGEHPLSHRHPGEDAFDEVHCLFGHAPSAATGADRAAFAGQRQEALERTVVAPDPQKAMHEQPAAEEAAELALDKAGQADPVGAGGGRGEEGLQMLLDHPLQDRVGGGARSIVSHGAGPSGFRAVRQRLAAGRQDELALGTEAVRCNTRRNRALHCRPSVGSLRSATTACAGQAR